MGIVAGFLRTFIIMEVFLFCCMYCCVRQKNGGNKKKPQKEKLVEEPHPEEPALN